MKLTGSADDPNHTAPDEIGATATEYVMLVAFVALALISTVTIFGSALNSYYVSLASNITSVLP
nr:Flp family type IVb pilin [Sinomonas gamaensis]